MKYSSSPNISLNIDGLLKSLNRAVDSPPLTYQAVGQITEQGMYIIYDGEKVIYVGKTNRTGKVRMRELSADFRSHTLNKKLLSKRLKDAGFTFERIMNRTKKEWIEGGIITEEVFKAHQSHIRRYIQSDLRFKFYIEKDIRRLISLEHFAIAVFCPEYND